MRRAGLRIVPHAGRPWLALLVLAAVLLRSFVPTGWMPNTAGDGRAPLVICTGAGPEGVHVHPHRDDGGHSRGARHHDACVFAGFSPAPGPGVIDYVPPFSPAIGARADVQPEAAPPPRRIHREQAARAPPLLI